MLIVAKDQKNRDEIIERLEDFSFFHKYLKPSIEEMDSAELLNCFSKFNTRPKNISKDEIVNFVKNQISIGGLLFNEKQTIISRLRLGNKLDLATYYKYSDIVYFKENIPSIFEFEPNHPQIKFVYKKHPRSDLYPNFLVDLASYERIILDFKKQELIEFLIELGACEIEISEKEDNSGNISASFDANFLNKKVKSSVKGNKKDKKTESKITKLSLRGHDFDGNHDFSKLTWLKSEPLWEMLITARNTSNLKKYEQLIEFHQTCDVDAEIKAALKISKLQADSKLKSEYQNKVLKKFHLKVEFP
ncbi:hypothetical protein [Providencia sp. PROV254]|uniref:hypothetical protein n=1 Tax=Providencia sp. PROV254 TaxID=2949942 RepID=UPI0023493E48|nr:hypothetical protein [Providencia sp. PROV254]HEP0304255.1 hypothetical protein [Providencia rettgeri]